MESVNQVSEWLSGSQGFASALWELRTLRTVHCFTLREGESLSQCIRELVQ
jgi:hypothetical protein